jgi:thioredoxin-related protein
LDQKTYPNNKVVDLAQKFIPVKINVEKTPEVATKYNITGIPAILFIDTKGSVQHTVEGFHPPDAFVKEMQTALDKLEKAKK